MSSAAIDGTNYGAARSFTIATSTTASTPTSIARGEYVLAASGAGCWVRLGGAAANIDTVTAQPSSPNGALFVSADTREPFTVTADTTISAITPSGTGTLRVIGPIGKGSGG